MLNYSKLEDLICKDDPNTIFRYSIILFCLLCYFVCFVTNEMFLEMQKKLEKELQEKCSLQLIVEPMTKSP